MFCLHFDMGKFSDNFVQPSFSSSFLKKTDFTKLILGNRLYSVIAIANFTNTQTENGWMILEVQTRERDIITYFC